MMHCQIILFMKKISVIIITDELELIVNIISRADGLAEFDSASEAFHYEQANEVSWDKV